MGEAETEGVVEDAAAEEWRPWQGRERVDSCDKTWATRQGWDDQVPQGYPTILAAHQGEDNLY